jgi:thiamine-phosphate pyrophosphorylase
VTTRPRLCLVTDRRRLVRVLGAGEGDARVCLLQQIQGAVAGGVDIVQIREPDLNARDLAGIVRAALAAAAGTSTRVFVNDRVDVAVATAAHGVHLRHLSMPTNNVRELAPQLSVGRSVHTLADVARAGPADYLIAGTVFATRSKPELHEPIGADGLHTIVRAAGAIPVMAIGGLTERNVRRVVDVGAAGIAAIGAFIPDNLNEAIDVAVQKRVEVLRRGFDASSAVP